MNWGYKSMEQAGRKGISAAVLKNIAVNTWQIHFSHMVD